MRHDLEYVELQRCIEIAELRSKGIQDRHLLDWKFSVANDSEGIQKAKRYVECWEKVKEENLGLLLWGNVGTGKSFIAACIANALIDKGVSVLMTNFTKIISKMGSLRIDEVHEYISSFGRYDLLIIDDLGIERNTNYAQEQLYAVIDERYKSNLPLIVTTNLTPTQLENASDIAHARVYSRILEMCAPVLIDGTNRRTAIADTKKALARTILFPDGGLNVR